MSQIHCSVDADVESELRVRARAKGLPLSKYVADVLTKEVRRGWPPGWFERVPGSWVGPLERPPQGEFEKREPL